MVYSVEDVLDLKAQIADAGQNLLVVAFVTNW